MSQSAYDAIWRECIHTVNEQLHIEDVGTESHDAKASKNDEQLFSHFACLYIKYLQILHKLHVCYDCMVHPQKRIDVKSILELVIRRVIELKHKLVVLNVRKNKDTKTEEPAAREYIHLIDILVDLKLSTEILNIPIPKYFCEDSKAYLNYRNNMITGYMKSNLGVDAIYIPESVDPNSVQAAMTIDQAIELIQRNERGRQGITRAAKFKEIRENERKANLALDAPVSQKEMPEDIAATSIQRFARGIISRRAAVLEREKELKFIGMLFKSDNVDFLANEAKVSYVKKKQEQAEHKSQYDRSEKELEVILRAEEGPDYMESIKAERVQWLTDRMWDGNPPVSMDEFKATFAAVESEVKVDAKAEAKESKAGKAGKGDKAAKDDKKDAAEDEPAESKSKVLAEMHKLIADFEEIWLNRDETNNFAQTADAELSKKKIRANVEEALRAQVDELLNQTLSKIKQQMGKGKPAKGKKGGKGGKKGGKKGKGKKGKDKGKSASGDGVNRGKLPGDKLSDKKDANQMLSILIENELVVCSRDVRISSLLGDFNYIDKPYDPSYAQLRQNITEYCILSNGSADIKKNLDSSVKSIMFYGPAGSGKTMAVEAIATELGAMIIHLTPEKINKMKNNYGGKQGATKLLHMVFSVAWDPAMQPSIIYLDECEEFFNKKSKDKEGLYARFKKDFLTYRNKIDPSDRVIIIGTTKTPERGDTKEYRAFFDKILYFPYPDYATRVVVWRHFYTEMIRAGLKRPQDAALFLGSTAIARSTSALEMEESINTKVRNIVEGMDISSLAFISEGYTVGSIAKTIKHVVSSRRVSIIHTHPLVAQDFIDCLSSQDYVYADERTVYLEFSKAFADLPEPKAKGGKSKGAKKGKGKK